MTIALAEEMWQGHTLAIGQMGRISGAAAVGNHCIWCDLPPGDRAVCLLPEAPWRACCRCYLARLAAMITWCDWHDHIARCTPCKHGEKCFVARGRRHLHQEAAALLGEPLRCFPCNEEVTGQDLVVAVIWEGDTSPHPGYAHVLCLAHHTKEGQP
ncbi:hypothetical protein [Streptomyces sp. NPDC051665]|uniref:hypothetical protein n=1 Tax=Streptomyces sp. NPDC051665 TaxID=3154647 RepID=UPI003434E524